MWTCPKCGRRFKNKNQAHSCNLVTINSLFARRSPELKELNAIISGYANALGKFREEAVPPDVIFFKTKSSFLGIKVKKDHLDVEFFLDRLEEDPVISKSLQTSRHRFVHIVPIDCAEDITDQLKDWIRKSFTLING